MASMGGCRQTRAGLGLFLAALLAATLAAAPARADADEVNVVLDQAKLVQLPDRVATLVIGNPLIVDAALQVGGTMVLTGKGYGVTNVLALDRNGDVVMEKAVRVAAPRNTVVVYRGMDRHTYSCAPKCERQVVPGDAESAFNLTLGQTVSRNTQAQGAAR